MQLSRSRAQRRVVRTALAQLCPPLRDRGSQQGMTGSVQQRMLSNEGMAVHLGVAQHRQGTASSEIHQPAKHEQFWQQTGRQGQT